MSSVGIRISDARATASLDGLLRAMGWEAVVVAPETVCVALANGDRAGPEADSELARLRLAIVSWQVARPTVHVSFSTCRQERVRIG